MQPDPAAPWSAGDYTDIARTIEPVAGVVVGAAGVERGDAVLDVATGTGNVALVAASRGAHVTGVDITPELLEVARRRAEEAGLRIDLVEGDAQALPCDDFAFDRVTSVFGAMFAADHERTAAELVRACRPGGTIAFAAWTPAGLNGQMFVTLAPHLPPPPAGFQPPILWGREDHVRRLFADVGEITCETRAADGSVHAESPDAWVEYLTRTLGPLAVAHAQLESDGRWAPVRKDLVRLYERFNDATDGTMRAAPEYLLTVVRKAA